MNSMPDFDFRAQNEELKRLRQQNLISIRKNEKSIEACRKLEKSLVSIGHVCAQNKTEPKYENILSTLKLLSNTTKEYNEILRECCIEPGQRIENLHNKIEENIMIHESLERQFKEKKIKYERTVSKYGSNSQRSRSQAKVAQASAELETARENLQKVSRSLQSGLPELLGILPRGLSLASDVLTTAQLDKRYKIKNFINRMKIFQIY